MKPYADLPGRRAAQLLTDALVVVWVLLCVRLGQVVHDAVLALAAPALRLESAGGSFDSSMVDASRTVRQVPLVGGQLHGPFDRAAATGQGIAGAGHDLAAGITRLATILGWATALVPIGIVGGVWLVRRVRFARLASAAQRLVDSDAGLELFALRAMSRQALPRLARVSPDPVGAWRAGDRRAIQALAALELQAAGLRPPAPEAGGSLSPSGLASEVSPPRS